MTNPKVQRKDVLSPKEIEEMLRKADEIYEWEYFRLRAKALISLFRSGKRRGEVVALEMSDLRVEDGFLYITFTTEKKRRKKVLTVRRTKRYPLSSKYAKYILDYWMWMKKHHPECRFLFPSIKSIFGGVYIFSRDKHLSGRHVLRIIKELNPRAWCHLFRETRGAEIVKRDEQKKGAADIFTVYKVKHALDLEREQTAWRYINRYATETITPEETEIIE